VNIDFYGISPMFGGRPIDADTGKEPEQNPEQSFSKAHYEQHVRGTGTIEVDGESFEINGLGLRDKSWGHVFGKQFLGIAGCRWLSVTISQ
jgi:hypothetical protein